MQLVQLVALAFVDVLRIPFVMAVLDIHLANLEVEQDQEDIHLVAQAERQVNMDAGNLDSKSEVLANFYHLKFTKSQLFILMLEFFSLKLLIFRMEIIFTIGSIRIGWCH